MYENTSLSPAAKRARTIWRRRNAHKANLRRLKEAERVDVEQTAGSSEIPARRRRSIGAAKAELDRRARELASKILGEGPPANDAECLWRVTRDPYQIIRDARR